MRQKRSLISYAFDHYNLIPSNYLPFWFSKSRYLFSRITSAQVKRWTIDIESKWGVKSVEFLSIEWQQEAARFRKRGITFSGYIFHVLITFITCFCIGRVWWALSCKYIEDRHLFYIQYNLWHEIRKLQLQYSELKISKMIPFNVSKASVYSASVLYFNVLVEWTDKSLWVPVDNTQLIKIHFPLMVFSFHYLELLRRRKLTLFSILLMTQFALVFN